MIRTLPKISSTPFVVAILGIAIFLMGGGLYNLLIQTPAVIQTRAGTFTFFTPFDINTQLTSESAFSMIFLSLSVAGAFVSYSSARRVATSRTGTMLLLTGLLMLVMGVIGINFLLQLKIPSA
ncbi:MAG: hypothetical protein ACE5KO_02605 [Candidatus Bathyarchaeia archaeon]